MSLSVLMLHVAGNQIRNGLCDANDPVLLWPRAVLVPPVPFHRGGEPGQIHNFTFYEGAAHSRLSAAQEDWS